MCIWWTGMLSKINRPIRKGQYQRDGLWLARMDLATHSIRPNTVGF